MNFYSELKHNMRLAKADQEYKKRSNETLTKALEENKFACVCLKAEKFELALKHFENSFQTIQEQLEIQSTNILMNIGNFYAQQKQHQKAVEYYKRVVNQSPYFDESQKVPIIHFCSKINSFEAFVDAHTNLACLLTNLDKPEEAYEYCLKAIQLQPNNYEAQINFGDLLRQLGRQKEAIDHTWKQIVQISDQGYQEPKKIDVKSIPIEQNDLVNVICMKWGTKYGPDYVNKLYNGFKRHCTRQFNFICVTDDPKDLQNGIITRELKKGWTGWWGKATLFMDYYEYPPGKLFFIDLDMIITGNVDEIMDYKGAFGILKTDEIACEKQNKNGYNSSIVIWNNREVFKRIFTELDSNWKNIQKFIVRFDFWLEMIVENADFLQDIYPTQISDFVFECKEQVPQNTRIVTFPRMPKPDSYPAEWIKEKWI
ncbi:unnamed protein product [Paramecium primaurelia]|uniref:Tetratricopeptide repeat protein n=1 Tax=Paramecium primaurelia TaxID=5886 RepID=A0A8S1P718_PARPR|nr:unnamed protein product [Paramecium primaurelia]